jgi:hypothetical protein
VTETKQNKTKGIVKKDVKERSGQWGKPFVDTALVERRRQRYWGAHKRALSAITISQQRMDDAMSLCLYDRMRESERKLINQTRRDYKQRRKANESMKRNHQPTRGISFGSSTYVCKKWDGNDEIWIVHIRSDGKFNTKGPSLDKYEWRGSR